MACYVTVNRPNVRQLTFDDFLHGMDISQFAPQRDTRNTITWMFDSINAKLSAKADVQGMLLALQVFVTKYNHLIEREDKSTLYHSFKIPKRSGGLRQIDAPTDELKEALYDLKDILEKRFCASYHTSAYAYVRGRSTIDAVKKHQANNSRWFLKMDMRHFFPSTTPEFLMKMMCMSYPFCEFIKYSPECGDVLKRALSLCFLRGGLPQGTPTSPLLTNIMMIPIDHAINKMCHEHRPHLCYTRYADDILISSQYDFMWSDVRNKVVDIITGFDAPFTLNPEKTRYGSSAGRNWNLGVMLNAENKITIGHEKKKVFKAMLFQFMTDYSKGKKWSVEDVQHLLGLISYYRMVERSRIDEILKFYSDKFSRDIEVTAKELLKP